MAYYMDIIVIYIQVFDYRFVRNTFKDFTEEAELQMTHYTCRQLL